MFRIYFLACFISVLTVAAVAAQSPDAGGKSAALEKEMQGYLEILKNGPSDPAYRDTVLTAAQKAHSVDAAREILSKYGTVVEDPEYRKTVYLRLARLSELCGELDAAAEAYLDAARAARGPDASRASLQAARILFELGKERESRQRAEDILADGEGIHVQRAAALLLARVHAANDENDAALSIVKGLAMSKPDSLVGPEVLLLYHELAARTGDAAQTATALSLLKGRYPDSPEYAIAAGNGNETVSAYPSLSRLLNPLVVDKSAEDNSGSTAVEAGTQSASGPARRATAVQTGSFKDAENAAFMVKDLEKLGYKATVREAVISGTHYYQVVIPLDAETDAKEASRNAEQVILQLKEHGLEGMLQFDE